MGELIDLMAPLERGAQRRHLEVVRAEIQAQADAGDPGAAVAVAVNDNPGYGLAPLPELMDALERIREAARNVYDVGAFDDPTFGELDELLGAALAPFREERIVAALVDAVRTFDGRHPDAPRLSA